MLLSLSLKFGPPTKPVLEEVSGAALATLGKVHEWAAEGESIIYASNSAVSGIPGRRVGVARRELQSCGSIPRSPVECSLTVSLAQITNIAFVERTPLLDRS